MKYIEIDLTADPFKDKDFICTLKKLIERVLCSKGYRVFCRISNTNLINNFKTTCYFPHSKNELQDIEEEINFIIHNTEAYYSFL